MWARSFFARLALKGFFRICRVGVRFGRRRLKLMRYGRLCMGFVVFLR